MAEIFRNDSEDDLRLAIELMDSIDFDTLGSGGGDETVDRTQAPQRDEIDPGTLLSPETETSEYVTVTPFSSNSLSLTRSFTSSSIVFSD